MPEVSDILKRYANARIKALQSAQVCSSSHLQAYTRIKNVAEYFSGKPEPVQVRAVRQIKDEIFLLLPSEQSRFAKLRITILDILEKSQTTN
jgi:hypothetical protein